MSERQLSLARSADAELELVDAELVTSAGAVASAAPSPPPRRPSASAARTSATCSARRERIAARAATASTRRQYGAIFRAFGDWLAGELGRPPVVGDLDADVIAAYGRHLATSRWSRRPAGGAGDRARVSVDDPGARPRARSRGGGRRRARAAARARAAGDAHRHRLRQPAARPRPAHASPASATTRCCASSATAGCARPSCAACGPGICAARAPTPATTGSTCAAYAEFGIARVMPGRALCRVVAGVEEVLAAWAFGGARADSA